MMKRISIAICDYPNVLKSALYGLQEMFLIANRVCQEQGVAVEFEPIVVSSICLPRDHATVIVLPPSLSGDDYQHPDAALIDWLKSQHRQGAIIASACAGAFILAATGLVDTREVTTHWNLSTLFEQQFPHIKLNTSQILIAHGDVISAGGVMSWLDLGFELVVQFASLGVMRQLGKLLVVDTAVREQRFYQPFIPRLSHGDSTIISLQQLLNVQYPQPLSIHSLAQRANMTERTLQRRFSKATGYNPNHYLQRLRVQKACDLLESSIHSFDWIAHQVGYEDVSACRKVFIKTMGLTPSEFRMRFGRM
jgi:transcriptional regulator GlxA family with amidase domain